MNETPTPSLRIAAAQTEILFERPTENLETAKAWIRQAKQKQADCIFFPEMSFTGFSMHTETIASFSDTFLAEMQKTAKTNAIAIGFGFAGKDADGRFRNHYIVLDQRGAVLSDFAKLHPFSYAGEDAVYAAGQHIVREKLNGVPYSTLLCYDLRFPEVFRLAARDASLILVPANWLSVRHEQFQILLQARAIENQVYILGLNCVGTQAKNRFLGGSCLLTPEGEIVWQCGAEAEMPLFLWQDQTCQYRSAFSCRKDARLRWYGKQYLENF